MVATVFTTRPVTANVTASLFVALSPFCLCGVVPLAASLLVAGVPIAPVLAFCIASPIMDPEMFMLTAAGLGLEFAVMKTIAAFGMGMFAGFLAPALSHAGLLSDVLKPIATPSCGASGAPDRRGHPPGASGGRPTGAPPFPRRRLAISSSLAAGLCSPAC